MNEDVYTSESEDEIEKVQKILKSHLKMSDNSSSSETSDAEDQPEPNTSKSKKKKKMHWTKNHSYHQHRHLPKIFQHLRSTLSWNQSIVFT